MNVRGSPYVSLQTGSYAEPANARATADESTEEEPVLEEFAGIPAHPLLIHAPVVFVPLLAITAVAYGFVGLIRPHTRWVLGLLALAAPLSALLAKLSGDALFDRLDRNGQITEGFYPVIENHQNLGTTTLYATIVLGVLTLGLVYLVPPGAPSVIATGDPGRRQILLLVLRVLVLAAAAVSVYYVIRTGDSGSHAVWEGT
jgi:uncharacterized membrane protein